MVLSGICTDSTFFLGASITKTWVVIALLSFSPELNILFLFIPQDLARRLMYRLVSQFVIVTLATVNLPFSSKAGTLDDSSTLKSSTRAFSSPPMPSDGTAQVESPRYSSISLPFRESPPQSLMLESSLAISEHMSLRILSAFLPLTDLTYSSGSSRSGWFWK